MENEKKLKYKILLKSLENSFETGEETNSSFWGLSNSLFNLKDYFKYNLFSLNYKFKMNDKSIIHIFNKAFRTPNIEFMNQKLKSLILITYRNNYKPQINSKNETIYNSDCGWGCMIRSCQMILARAIYKIFKYEENQKKKEIDKDFLIKSVIYFFLDNNIKLTQSGKTKNYFGMDNYILKLKNYNEKNFFGVKREICSIEPPFSIQKICTLGEIYDKTCGEWFSDYDLPKIFNLINEPFNVFPQVKINHYNSNLELNNLIERCLKEIKEEKNEEKNEKEEKEEKEEKNENKEKYIIFDNKKYIFNKMGIIFISIRLGLESISPEYFPAIKQLFDCKEFLGFVGGRVQSASYFFGYVDDDLLFLDPHYNQISVKDLEKEGISSYLNKTIYKLPFNNLQTALTLCFLFRNMDELIDFLRFCKIISKENVSTFFISGIKKLEINEND